MWRKAQLSGVEGLDNTTDGEGRREGEGGGVESWMTRAQETINSLRNGELGFPFCHVRIISNIHYESKC